jgi:hypothetical protein
MHRNTGRLVAILLVMTAAASAIEIKVLALDSKTGDPLHRKKFCLQFSTDVRTGPPTQCGRTDTRGLFTIQLPTPTPANVWSFPQTNDLVACYRTDQAVPVTVIETIGYVASGGGITRESSTCGVVRNTPNAKPGVLIVFAHQMSLWEALHYD